MVRTLSKIGTGRSTYIDQPKVFNNLLHNLLPFNKKSVDYIARTRHSWLNIAEGGKRAGKNVMNIIAWCQQLEFHPQRIHIISGVTKSITKTNILDSNGYGVLAYFEGRILKDTYNGFEAYYIHTLDGQEKVILVFAGGNAGDDSKLQGMTVGSFYITEINLVHKTFLKEALTRMDSHSHKLLFGDLNPKPPGHWFYKEFLDFHTEQQKKNPSYGYNYEHFTILDNNSLTIEQIKVTFSRYDQDSIFFKMDILGQRLASVGKIYTSFEQRNVIKDVLPFRPYKFAIGIDVGGTDATVATLTAFDYDFRQVCLLEGYYDKQGNINDFHDETSYVNAIVDQIELWSNIYDLEFNTCVYVDSAAKLFKRGVIKELRRRGFRFPVNEQFKKDKIEHRIKLNVSLIVGNRFFIMNRPVFKQWIEAYENATWDEKEFEDGKFVRLDNGSYPVDCLDATEYTLYPYKDKLV